MFDFFTYFVYICLLIISIILTIQNNRNNHSFHFRELNSINLRHILTIICISFIVAIRYNVGVDWGSYVQLFNEYQNFSDIEYNIEIGAIFINKMIIFFGLNYQWMFFTFSIFTWYFFFKSINTLFIPLFIFFLFTDEWFFWGMNGIRQFLAMSIWVYSINFIINKEYKKFLIAILLGSLYHKSILFLIPFYFIPKKYSINTIILIFIFVSTAIIGNNSFFINILQRATNIVGENVTFLNSYSVYIDYDNFIYNKNIQIGFGYMFRFFVNFFIIVVSQSFIKKNPDLYIYFIIFFIGAIISNLAYNVQIVGRINNYFLILRPFILSIIIWDYFKRSNFQFLAIVICLMYFILFLSAIYMSSNMCSPYNYSF